MAHYPGEVIKTRKPRCCDKCGHLIKVGETSFKPYAMEVDLWAHFYYFGTARVDESLEVAGKFNKKLKHLLK
jgi:ribosomal protein L31